MRTATLHTLVDQLSPLCAAEARTTARDACVFGTPMVDMYKTMYAEWIDWTNPQFKGPLNTILNVARLPTPDDTIHAAADSDTQYSCAGLDLRAEPIVITIPKMEDDRYFVFQLTDLYSVIFDSIGTRTTGNDGGTFLVAGPAWKGRASANITKVIRADTDLVNVVGRTQLFNSADLERVKAIQAGYTVEPLSVFAGTRTPVDPPKISWIPAMVSRDRRAPLEFFNQLAFLLQFAPSHPSEIALRDRFARIGIVPGKRFVLASLPASAQSALEAGLEDGHKEIDVRAALRGIGPVSEDVAVGPIYERDSDGQLLDGSNQRYMLQFEKGQLPPAIAFWSLAMYSMPGRLLVKNPINRYVINSPMLPSLTMDADDGLTIYIQSDSPGSGKEWNWLPAPKGPFTLVMQCYWPAQALLEGRWQSPPVVRHPGARL